MKRWDSNAGPNSFGAYIENERVDAFLREITEVCKKHGFSLSHEDKHGAFEVTPYSEPNVDWLNNANVDGIEADK